MLIINVQFLHGTVRSSNYENVSMTGSDSGEWPPSPARLFSAFVAADGSPRFNNCNVTSGDELNILEVAGHPAIHADRKSNVLSSKLNTRFVVSPANEKLVVHNYLGKTATPIRPGTRLSLSNPNVVYVWPDLELNDVDYRALQLRAARIGYLGCSDSPVRIKVSRLVPEEVPSDTWISSSDGEAYIPVTYDGMLEDLDNLYERFLGGEPAQRSSAPVELARYRTPNQQDVKIDSRNIFWLRFDESIPYHAVRLVTETLRNAVLDIYEKEVAGSRDEVPEILHGHGDPDKAHVQWLALPNVEYQYSDGSIRGAAIVLPNSNDAEIINGLNTVIYKLQSRSLTAKNNAFSVAVTRWDGDKTPWTVVPKRWTGPSRLWTSVFPVLHETFNRKGVTLESISFWCSIAGLPRPVAFRECVVPLLQGAQRLHGSQVRRKNDRRPFSHMEIVFNEPITGPVVIGAGRHFGLGLFAPTGRDS